MHNLLAIVYCYNSHIPIQFLGSIKSDNNDTPKLADISIARLKIGETDTLERKVCICSRCLDFT